jgi:hypothetical protein
MVGACSPVEKFSQGDRKRHGLADALQKKLSPARRTADIALALFQDCAYPPDMTRRVGASDT